MSKRGAYCHSAAITGSSPTSLHICPVYVLDEQVFMFLVLLKEMRTQVESKMLSFSFLVVFVPLGVDATLGNGCRIRDRNCFREVVVKFVFKN